MFDIHHTKEVVIRQPNNDLPPPREEHIPPAWVRQTSLTRHRDLVFRANRLANDCDHSRLGDPRKDLVISHIAI